MLNKIKVLVPVLLISIVSFFAGRESKVIPDNNLSLIISGNEVTLKCDYLKNNHAQFLSVDSLKTTDLDLDISIKELLVSK